LSPGWSNVPAARIAERFQLRTDDRRDGKAWVVGYFEIPAVLTINPAAFASLQIFRASAAS
jgi:hypothetical protein